jgi:hypothetical protein
VAGGCPEDRGGEGGDVAAGGIVGVGPVGMYAKGGKGTLRTLARFSEASAELGTSLRQGCRALILDAAPSRNKATI